MKTCAPGRKAREANFAHSMKNSRKRFRSRPSNAVNRGRGARVYPSKLGGIRQMRPFPFARLSNWSKSYSFTP